MTDLTPERIAEIEARGMAMERRANALRLSDPAHWEPADLLLEATGTLSSCAQDIRDLLADRERLASEIATHEQFLEVLDSACLTMNGRGIRESLRLIRRVASGEREEAEAAVEGEPHG